MIFSYDGTIEGLLTIIFDAYKDLESVSIGNSSNLFEEPVFIKTDKTKANRVKKSLIDRFSYNFSNR